MERKIGFISGCFDAFHRGHSYILNKMREDCNYLVVALNDDNYIRRHKREPIVDEEERKNELYIFGVDEVVIFREDSPIKIIETIRPDIIYVGDDYSLDKIIGWPECEEWGGEVKVIERVGDYSTTNLVNKA